MKPVNCKQHGASAQCIICTHLQERDGLGYFAIDADGSEPAQAWCEACDVVMSQERGWTERATAFADWQQTCEVCCRNRLRAQTLISRVEVAGPVEA